MIRNNSRSSKRVEIIRYGAILLIFVLLLSGCSSSDTIKPTQKNDYVGQPYVDYSLTGLPEFVDDVSLCTDAEKQYVLPDGYIYECKPVPVYSVNNSLHEAVDTDGSVYNQCGYLNRARVRGVLEIGESDQSFVTGLIPAKAGDTVYFNGQYIDPEHNQAHVYHIVFYDSDKQIVSSTAMNTAFEKELKLIESESDDILAVMLRDVLGVLDVAYVRFTLLGSGEGCIVSVNEPLVPTSYEDSWVATEKYFAPEWYTEIEDTVDKINNLDIADDSQTIKFLFATDIHLSPYLTSSHTDNIGKVCAEVMSACDIPFFVTGGDNCTQSTEFMPSDFEPNMQDLLKQLQPIPQKNIILSVGNHDGATGMKPDENGEPLYYRYQLNNEERSRIFFEWQRESNEYKHFDSDGTYYYLDDASTKTRYIVLNSFWSLWEGDEDGFVSDVQHSFFQSHRFGPKQLKWFATTALDMPPNYSAVIVVHFAPGAYDFEIFKGIVDAFSAQTVYEGEYVGAEEWQNVSMAVNYENANGEIIAVFQGHNHTNAEYDYFESVPCINTTTTGAHWAVKDENAQARIKDTASEFAVDAVVIDKTERKIYITRLGAGEDRVIDY